MSDMPISENMAASLGEIRTHDHDRFLTLLFAPMPQRQSLIALYAFNLEIARVAESVTEPMMGHIRLQWWRETLEGVPRGETRGHAAAIALQEAMLDNSGNPDPAALQPLIDARERDLSDDVFADMAALESYAEATSSSLMALAAQALGGTEKAAAAGEAIRHAGLAYALTGLLRALPFHASQGRLKMPADLLQKHNVDPHSILTGKMTDGLRGVMRDVADRARSHLALARAARFDPALLPALMPASLCERYLDLMTAPGFDPFLIRTDVSVIRRQLRLLGRNLRKRI
tara:strand:+ start:2143 stop:3006 length:864 start_codon:yes stop_codon:yes gene_type:complete